jgi:signal transduction histidine kinase
MTVAQAAGALGISAEAVRGRIRRGTIPVEREGRAVYVLLDNRTTDDQTGTTDDRSYDQPVESGALISELRGRIEDLRTDRDAWRDQARRSDYMASAAMERTHELENRLRALEPPASSEPTEAAETVEEASEEASPRPAVGGAQAGAQRPWWRRVLGR